MCTVHAGSVRAVNAFNFFAIRAKHVGKEYPTFTGGLVLSGQPLNKNISTIWISGQPLRLSLLAHGGYLGTST